MISDGKLLAGSDGGNGNGGPPKFPSYTALQNTIIKTYHAFAIPAVWAASHINAFIIDTGVSCDNRDPLSPKYLSYNTAQKSGVCYNNRIYYLAHPEGEALECNMEICDSGCIPTHACYQRAFSMVPSMDLLNGRTPYQVSRDDVLIG